jgi:diguanylate cyclase (GGDEF)-like protein
LSVVLFDIDHFKSVNDNYGHPAGDRVLAAVARSLGKRLRPSDVLARYGGEEFVLLLPATDSDGAAVVAERLRQQVAQLCHDIGGSSTLRVTLSAGYATLDPGSAATADMLLASADAALYVAKRSGRNRVAAGQVVGRQLPGTDAPAPTAVEAPTRTG